jgi:hypothetical protein
MENLFFDFTFSATVNPWNIGVYTVTNPASMSTGFQLKYMQVACM